ncbi:MAG: signal peptide peptidase SppA [Anaerovoracaceae bacterium]
MDNLENRENQTQERPESQVQYYSEGRFSNDPESKAVKKPKKPLPTWAKALIIIGAVILVIVLLATGCNKLVKDFKDEFKGTDTTTVETDFGHDYIGVVYVEGEISEDGTATYNHAYILNSIEAMINDSENKGMILYVDTPGGSVFASDELYFKVKEYQEKTGRPVYSSMQSQATSGGYYISASCDKIIANRNCWTGSIGVTMGTIYDVTGLLEKAGIKTQTITSGRNKAMGSSTEKMTAEQREILQSLVDEAYDQFVGIVAEGRGLKESKVRELADGRIYTALQAQKLGLVDEIGTFKEAVVDMQEEYGLNNCQIEDFQSASSADIWSILGESAESRISSGTLSADMIEALTDLNGKVEFSYISEIRK